MFELIKIKAQTQSYQISDSNKLDEVKDNVKELDAKNTRYVSFYTLLFAFSKCKN